MEKLAIFVAVAGLPAGLGSIIDMILLRRHKGRIHNALTKFWVFLDDTPAPSFHRVLIDLGLGVFERYNRNKIAGLFFALVLSGYLTVCAVSLGTGYQTGRYFFWGGGSLWRFTDLTLLILANFPFDYLTIAITGLLLSTMQRVRQYWLIPLVLVDLTASVACALGCLLATDSVLLGGVSPGRSQLVSDILLLDFESVVGSLNRVELYYAATTLLPTIIYLAVLTTLYVAKAMAATLLAAIKYLLERVTEVKDPRDTCAFTLTGALFSALVIVGTFVLQIAG